MGHIYQEVRLRADKAITTRMLVDTGATFSVTPRKKLLRMNLGEVRYE